MISDNLNTNKLKKNKTYLKQVTLILLVNSSTIPVTLARGASLTELKSSATAYLTACEDSTIVSW